VTSTSRPNRRNNRRLTTTRLTLTATPWRDGRPPPPVGRPSLAGKRSRGQALPLSLMFDLHTPSWPEPVRMAVAITVAPVVGAVSQRHIEMRFVQRSSTTVAARPPPRPRHDLDAPRPSWAPLPDAPAHRRPPSYLRRAPHIGARPASCALRRRGLFSFPAHPS
jgi:hypothetical protein